MRSGPVARGTSQPRPYPAPALSGRAVGWESETDSYSRRRPTLGGSTERADSSLPIGRGKSGRTDNSHVRGLPYGAVRRQDPIALECLDLDARRIDKVLEPVDLRRAPRVGTSSSTRLKPGEERFQRHPGGRGARPSLQVSGCDIRVRFSRRGVDGPLGHTGRRW